MCMGVSVYECIGVYVCMGIWVYECMGGCMSVWVCV